MGGKGGTTINQPDPVDPAQASGEYLFGKDFESYQGVTDRRLQERIIGAEEEFRPRYAALELADIETFAKGVDGQGGLFDLLEDSGRRASKLQRESLGEQRDADVQALQDLSPQVVEAYRAADPQSTRLANLAEQQAIAAAEQAGRGGTLADLAERQAIAAAEQADSAFARASEPMGFEAQRQVDQSVLGNMGGTAFSQQGRSSLEAALGREQYRQNREQFAAGLRQSAAGIGQSAQGIRQSAMGMRQSAAGMGQSAFNQSRSIAGDLGAAILGRPSQGLGLGGQILGQAQTQASGAMGPNLFDPNVGINMAMQQRSDNISLLGAQAQADASRSSGMMGMLGSLGGAAIGLCWVAREVYGATNPKWKQFREWMLNDSPSWFRKLYIKHGEKFAKFISDKPRIKAIIRTWMNTRIK